MGPGRAERQALLGGEREQAAAALVLAVERVGEVLPAAGADLDLGGDQLAGDRVGQHVVLRCRGLAARSNAFDQSSGARVEQRELLLEADREVGRGLEDLLRGAGVEALGRALGGSPIGQAH